MPIAHSTPHRARGSRILLLAVSFLWSWANAGWADEPQPTSPISTDSISPPLEPKVIDLGNQKFGVGKIRVDKAQHRFEVAATLLRNTPPLEFLAISKGGFKAYESLIEVNANAYEFNLACILIGLNPTKGPSHHFDPDPVEGDPVNVFVEWQSDGKPVRVDAAKLLIAEGKTLPASEWVYTGSLFTPDNRFLAHGDGTMIGFVHDPSSIIEHRSGYLGPYETITGNQELLPAVGSQVNLIVEHRGSTSEPKDPDTIDVAP